MKTYLVRSIGQNKGSPRIYIDAMLLARGGFIPGARFSRETSEGGLRITLRITEAGSHSVSGKKTGERTTPVLDLCNAQLLAAFEGLQAVRIVVGDGVLYIVPLASERNARERLERMRDKLRNEQPLATAGLSFGVGVLDHALAAGLRQAGVPSATVLANEIDSTLADQAYHQNDGLRADAVVVAAPMQELAQDAWALSKLPTVELLVAGIPCSGASIAGRSKRGLAMMEAHPEVGHLVAALLMLINKMQPTVIVLENVAQYANTASAEILRSHLRDSAYVTHEAVLEARQFGCLENRVRWTMVAVTRGINVDLAELAPGVPPAQTVADVLDPVALDDERWRTYAYLKTKEVRDLAKGNGFAMQTVSAADSSVPTLRKGYHKGGSTDPLLVHPNTAELLRKFTGAEHARIKGVPPVLVAGMSETEQHIALGQGVAYEPFKVLGQRLGQAIRAMVNQAADTRCLAPVQYQLTEAVG